MKAKWSLSRQVSFPWAETWSQADAYCTSLGKRLPTEAEWEKAARGTTVRAYPRGDASLTCTLADFYDELGTADNCVGDTSAVGSYPAGASPYEALDMAGNASEWVQDWYQADYYSNSPSRNPTGPKSGSTKIQRGGAWGSGGGFLRSADRNGNRGVAFSSPINGFRCAKSP